MGPRHGGLASPYQPSFKGLEVNPLPRRGEARACTLESCPMESSPMPQAPTPDRWLRPSMGGCGPVVGAQILRNSRSWTLRPALPLGICAAGRHVGSPGLASRSLGQGQRMGQEGQERSLGGVPAPSQGPRFIPEIVADWECPAGGCG